MTSEGLAYMKSCLDELHIPYEFMEWTSVPIPDPFWVGEYVEVESMNEDGMQETSFILTGTTKGKYYDLEQVKQSIRDYFTDEGLTAILPSGSGIAVMYGDSFPIPSVDESVHRIQVTLRIKEWRT